MANSAAVWTGGLEVDDLGRSHTHLLVHQSSLGFRLLPLSRGAPCWLLELLQLLGLLLGHGHHGGREGGHLGHVDPEALVTHAWWGTHGSGPVSKLPEVLQLFDFPKNQPGISQPTPPPPSRTSSKAPLGTVGMIEEQLNVVTVTHFLVIIIT